MNASVRRITGLVLFASLAGCAGNSDSSTTSTTTPIDSSTKGTYSYDAGFLKKHTQKVIELSDPAGQAKLLLSADYQGRVMTSTAMGDSGASFGWINYGLLESGEKKKQFNPVGGEERFWMGPEGGQYALYFKKGDSFSIANWQVPPVIDTEMYDVAESNSTKAVFTKNTTLTNYSGTTFSIAIQRTVNLLNRDALAQQLQVTIPENVHSVGYETINEIKNTGNEDWKQEKGLLSIWLLCMMTPTDKTTVIIPFHAQAGARSLITDNYFGAMPPERLVVKDSVLYFTCDGKKRSKIGLSPVIAKPIAGSYDFNKNVLSLIIYQVDKKGLYVNSKWELQKQPFKGDVVNSYNDGPLDDGSQLGPFYEIESSSAAKALKKGEAQQYTQVSCHLQGDYESLRQLAFQVLGVDLNELKK
jgi:hypothetical protein